MTRRANMSNGRKQWTQKQRRHPCAWRRRWRYIIRLACVRLVVGGAKRVANVRVCEWNMKCKLVASAVAVAVDRRGLAGAGLGDRAISCASLGSGLLLGNFQQEPNRRAPPVLAATRGPLVLVAAGLATAHGRRLHGWRATMRQ